MRKSTITRRTVLAGLIVSARAVGESDKDVLESVKAMEAREGLTIFTLLDAVRHRWRGARRRPGDTVWPGISPDATTLCWGRESSARTGEHADHGPFLTISSVKGEIRSVSLEGHWAGGFAISSGPGIIVTTALPLTGRGPTRILVVDLQSGLSVEDFTSKLPLRAPPSISGPGTLVVFGREDQLQICELPSCQTVYKETGRYPRLSPDGKRLAFIREARLYIRTLENGSPQEFLPSIQTPGIGGWSPDGRFLLAGAWTRRAFDKRLIVLDTISGRYAEIGTLGESDYGERLRWVSSALMER